MKNLISVSFFGLVLLLGLVLTSSAQERAKEELGGDIELRGLVVDEARTQWGREFYHDFCLSWEASKGEELEKIRFYYQILIEEFTSPQWGSLMQIKVNDVIVYQRFLTPRPEAIEDAATRAVLVVQKYVLERDLWEREAIEGKTKK